MALQRNMFHKIHFKCLIVKQYQTHRHLQKQWRKVLNTLYLDSSNKTRKSELKQLNCKPCLSFSSKHTFLTLKLFKEALRNIQFINIIFMCEKYLNMSIISQQINLKLKLSEINIHFFINFLNMKCKIIELHFHFMSQKGLNLCT